MAKSHQCKDFMQEVCSDELDSDVNFKMLNGKECIADVSYFLTEC